MQTGHSTNGETHWKHMSYTSANIGPWPPQTFWFDSKSDFNGGCKVHTPAVTVALLRAKWHHAVFWNTFLLRVWLRKKWVRKRPVNKALKCNCKLRRYLKNFEVEGLPLISKYMHQTQTIEETCSIFKYAEEILSISVSQCQHCWSFSCHSY